MLNPVSPGQAFFLSLLDSAPWYARTGAGLLSLL